MQWITIRSDRWDMEAGWSGLDVVPIVGVVSTDGSGSGEHSPAAA